MQAFRSLSIRRKLTLILLLTSSAALCVACFSLSAYEVFAFKRELEREYMALGEVIGLSSEASLRAGDLDLALIGQEGASLGDEEFYRQRIARIGVRAALPSNHPLADRNTISLSQLSGEGFIVPSETTVPGRKQWVTRLCREAGFRPRWLAQTEAVAETFARVVGERGVSLLPDYLEKTPPPGIALIRLSDQFATWDFTLLRQRGRMPPACRDLIRWIKETALSS